MGPRGRVRAAKCQMLVTSLLVLVTTAGPVCGHRGGSHLLWGPLGCHQPRDLGEEPVRDRAPLGLLRGNEPGRPPEPGGRAQHRSHREGGPGPHGRGLPELRPGLLRPGAGGLLGVPQLHPGGGRRAGHLRPAVRPGPEDRDPRPAAGASGHPGRVPVLREEVSFRPPGALGGRPVPGRGGRKTETPSAPRGRRPWGSVGSPGWGQEPGQWGHPTPSACSPCQPAPSGPWAGCWDQSESDPLAAEPDMRPNTPILELRAAMRGSSPRGPHGGQCHPLGVAFSPEP
ncbi:tetraspanin-32 isoform X1 [Microcebus murinus]|uniref:tetraspanin-32 isoform X1 n=1 Tax=Microcebus murinus TaxID=30608 RepID=UPI003F6C7D12